MLTLFYLFHYSIYSAPASSYNSALYHADPGGSHCPVGSLAGAANLLEANVGVLRSAQSEQKYRVEQKGNSSFDFNFQFEH